MPGQTVTTAANILKRQYIGPAREQIEQSNVLIANLEKNKEFFSGLDGYYALHDGRNQGGGARADGGTLMTAGRQTWSKAIYQPVYNYHRIKLTGPTIERARTNVGAFVNILDVEMKEAKCDMKKDRNRQVHADGSSLLTDGTAASSSTTVAVKSTRFIKKNMLIDVVNTSTGVKNGATLTVNSVTNATTFVADAAVTVASGEGIYKEASYPSSADGPIEMWGLQALISDANPGNGLSGATERVGQIDRSAAGNDFWQATVIDKGGTAIAISLLFLREMLDELEIAGATTPVMGITDHNLMRQIGDLFTSERRYPGGGQVTLNGGYKGLEFDESVLVKEVDAHVAEDPTRSVAAGSAVTYNRIYFVNNVDLEFIQLKPVDFLSRDNSILHWVTGEDAYEAVLAVYDNLATPRANGLGVLKGVG